MPKPDIHITTLTEMTPGEAAKKNVLKSSIIVLSPAHTKDANPFDSTYLKKSLFQIVNDALSHTGSALRLTKPASIRGSSKTLIPASIKTPPDLKDYKDNDALFIINVPLRLTEDQSNVEFDIPDLEGFQNYIRALMGEKDKKKNPFCPKKYLILLSLPAQINPENSPEAHAALRQKIEALSEKVFAADELHEAVDLQIRQNPFLVMLSGSTPDNPYSIFDISSEKKPPHQYFTELLADAAKAHPLPSRPVSEGFLPQGIPTRPLQPSAPPGDPLHSGTPYTPQHQLTGRRASEADSGRPPAYPDLDDFNRDGNWQQRRKTFSGMPNTGTPS